MTLKAILRSARGPSLVMRAVLGATLALAGVAVLVAPSRVSCGARCAAHIAVGGAFSRDRNRLGCERQQRESVRRARHGRRAFGEP